MHGVDHEIGPRDRSWTVNSPGSFRVSQNIFALDMYNNLLMKLLSNRVLMFRMKRNVIWKLICYL